MLIWLMAILLFAGFGALGYFKGAVRMIFPLVGLLVATLLALPLAPLVKPLIPLVGLKNPIWSILLPPVVVFFAISVVCIVVGFFGHAKMELFYKYRADDVTRLNWQRLNQRLGICVGIIAGAIYTIVIGVVVYVLGYLTVQVSPGDSDSAAVRTMNQAREQLRSSGLEGIVAAFDPAPDFYYDAADILGLLYHNPPLHSRLAAYPPFIALAEQAEFQNVATDADYQNMLAGQPTVGQVIEHEKTQAILANADLLQQLKSIDLRDLREYLRTGISEKYQDIPILGRWEIDPYLTFQLEKRRRRNMTAIDVKLLRYEAEFVRGFKVYISPDNRARLKGPDISQMIGKLTELAKAVAEGNKPRPQVQVIQAPVAQSTAPSESSRQYDRLMRDRYGRNPSAEAQAQAPTAAPVIVATPAPVKPMTTTELAAELAKLPLVTLAEGTWKDEGGGYVLSFTSGNNIPQFVGTKKSSEIKAAVRDERLFLVEKDQSMAMSRF